MNDVINKINTNELRVGLTRYLREYGGEVIYITKFRELVAELIIYTDKMKEKAELEIARKMLESAKVEHIEF